MRTPLDNDVINCRSIRQPTVVLDLDLSHILDVEHYSSARSQLAPVAVPIFQAVEAVAPLEARKSRLFACLQAAEEGNERFIQATEHLLDTCCVEIAERVGAGVTQVSEVRPLLVVAHTLARLFVNGDALLQRGIVERAPLPEKEVERSRLCARRIQSVAIGTDQLLSPLLLLNVPLDRCCTDITGRTNIVRACPE